MAARVLLLIICLHAVASEKSTKSVNDGLLNTLSTGMKFAKDFLGSESVALKVAEFVVQAFQNREPVRRPHNTHVDEEKDRYFETNNEHNEEQSHSADPLRHLVRLLGLQPPQMSALAVNAILFVAQMISTFLSGPHKSRNRTRHEDTTSWMLNKNSRTLQNLLSTAKNDSLSDMIEDIVGDQGSEEETSCIRLLICKITPFVVKMQKTVFGDNVRDDSFHGSSIMYRHLPTNNDINTRSDYCERKHRACDLNS